MYCVSQYILIFSIVLQAQHESIFDPAGLLSAEKGLLSQATTYDIHLVSYAQLIVPSQRGLNHSIPLLRLDRLRAAARTLNHALM